VILDKRRRPESELWESFEAVRPGIFGALLDAVSRSIQCVDDIKIETLPRRHQDLTRGDEMRGDVRKRRRKWTI